MRCVWLWSGALALGACGGGIPLEEISSEPVAFVRQEASQGLIGIDEFMRNGQDRGCVRIQEVRAILE